MSYVTYTTEALVCGHRVSNTSDKSVLLFTKDAGMVWANVKSVREERSRQRYALQDFSESRLSLVKGKTGWRIGSASVKKNFYNDANNRKNRGGVVAVMKLLRQFVHGEEPCPPVYDDTLLALSIISTVSADKVSHYLDLYSYRLLKNLGYIAETQTLTGIMTDDVWQTKDFSLPEEVQQAIKKAISVSHL